MAGTSGAISGVLAHCPSSYRFAGIISCFVNNISATLV
jgi:hypothetical protein